MGTNVIHSLCVSASVPLIARKRCCLRVSSTLRICVHCRMPFYIAPPFPVTPTFTSIKSTIIRSYHFATACLSFSVELAGWAFCLIDQVLTAIDFVVYCLLLCSHNTHAKLLTCYSYMMATRILCRSQSVLCCRILVTSIFFPLLSVYGSCSSSISIYIVLRFYKLSLIAMSLAAWVTQAQTLRKYFKLLLSSFPPASGSVPEVEY